MPIFEFVCTECEETFEELVFSVSKIDEVVCPTCGGSKVKKKMSTFASKPAAGSTSFSLNTASPSHSCGTGSV
jgi:putative FmdB family regulatory protein